MGFVVISADHQDNWSTLFGPTPWQVQYQRPNEVTRQIDYAASIAAPDGPLAGMIDTDRIGVVGWSGGGETALVAGGARLDLDNFRAWCEANKVDGEFPDTDCVDILDHEAELAALAGLDATPHGMSPDWSDKRVDAVIALAPGVLMLSPASIQSMDVPTLLVIGSGDIDVGPGYFALDPYEQIGSDRKAEVVLANAEHLVFFDDCDAAPDLVTMGFHVFCSDPVWDMARAHDLVNHFATAFLLAELKGDAEAAAALAPENVTFPGIQYEAAGYTQTAATPKVFVQGAPVRLAVGLAVGPDDKLYVSNQWIRSILALDPDTGEIIKRYGPKEGVDIPADLAFGPDGSLYASMYPGLEGDAIMRIAPDGTVTGMPLPPIIWPVMTTRNGRLFAGLLDANDMIVEVDPKFQSPPREVLSVGNFIHMREGPDGLIYAIKWFDGEIVRFDPDVPDSAETVATGLTLPFNLAFDSKGLLYIILGVDDATDAVARLDLATGQPEILATMHNLLYGLAIDSHDRIFVSSVDNGAVFEVLPSGDIRSISPGGMILPSDVTVIARADGESLFLADWGAWREYDIATGELRSARHGTWWPGTLTNPDTIAPFDGKLLLTSSENQQIQLWDPIQQKEVLLISYPGAANAIGFDGKIVAASFETKDVVRIDPANPDQPSVLAAGLAYPLGLATEGGDLYVGDFLAGKILQVVAGGITLDPPRLVAEGLQGPEGMALTGDGRLLVVESKADRLSIIDLANGQMSPVATELGILSDLPRSRPLHYFFNGVDIDASGTIFVTADGPNVIYRLPLPSK